MKNIHGEELLNLSDYQLFETVYLQIIDLVQTFASDEDAFLHLTPTQRTFYIVSIFDMELQNGGLCQFFVNSSCALAANLNECLNIVGAEEHSNLLNEFVLNNRIDLGNPDLFTISGIDDYLALIGQYDFATFEDAFFKLPALEEFLVAYVKANILDF